MATGWQIITCWWQNLGMNKTVHIWFNGGEVILPKDNGWEKFGDIDALRTFLICAESWQRNGWEVKRLSTLPVGNEKFDPISARFNYSLTPFHYPEFGPSRGYAGRVNKQFHWYKPEMWQYLAKLKSLCESGKDIMTASMDVINFGFTPGDVPQVYGGEMLYFQPEHFSLSSFVTTWPWLNRAEEIVMEYDRGELPEIRADYISDERILREYGTGRSHAVQKFACNPGPAPLIHFARSTLARIFHEIPLS